MNDVLVHFFTPQTWVLDHFKDTRHIEVLTVISPFYVRRKK